MPDRPCPERESSTCSCAEHGALRGPVGAGGNSPARSPALTPEFVAAAVGGRWIRPPLGGPAAAFRCVGIDSREVQPSSLFVAVRGERHDGHDHLASAAQAGAAGAMVSREVDLDALPPNLAVLRVPDTVAALQGLAAAWRRALGCVVVAITGSAGKTTTRRLVHAAISSIAPAVQSPKSFNNHLGVPLTLLSAKPGHRVVVAEIGMNAPGEIAALAELASPEIGAITTVGRAHLEGVGSLAGVAREKSDLLRRVRAGACHPLAVAPCDIAALRPYLLGIPALCLFGDSDEAHVRLVERRPLDGGQEVRAHVAEPGRAPTDLRFVLRLPGRHNALNALIAVVVARHVAAELSGQGDADGSNADERIVDALASVTPDAMRFQPATCRLAEGGPPVWVINDAYNANPESMAAALATFAEVAVEAPRRILVLGDMLELGSEGEALHVEVAERIVDLDQRAPLAAVVLVGGLMGRSAAELTRLAGRSGVQVIHHQELDQARASAIADLLRPGDAVLIKGSRGMALERVAAAIAARASGPAEASPTAGSVQPGGPSPAMRR